MLAQVTTLAPRLPQPLVAKMAASANTVIENVLLVGASVMRSPPRSEVGFVAAVTLGGITDIANAWIPLCNGAGLSIRLSGVFCHAAPLVNFKNGRRRWETCELADLLVVVDLGTGQGLVRRAALVQAKMARAAKRVSLTGPSSNVQRDLYQNWYRFDFQDPAYEMSAVNFRAGQGVAHTGTFGVIDHHLRCPPVWTQHKASPIPTKVQKEPQLGEFIAEMAGGWRWGFGRLASPSLRTDWSKAVEKLLTVTYQRAFGHRPTLGSARPRRGVTAIAYFDSATMSDLRSEIWDGAGGDPPFDDGVIRHEEGMKRGLSLFHVMITREPDRLGDD
jgi:hypothetical protein